MKKINLIIFALMTMLLSSCMFDLENGTDYSLIDNSQSVITFLHSPTCGNSCAAKKYVDETYPNAAIRYIDVDLEGNRMYLKAAKQDYGLGKNGQQIDTPVICFGNEYISGWTYEKRQLLDIYIQHYLKE